VLKSEFDTTLPGALTTATGIRDGNRLPSVPKFQISGNVTYSFPVGAGEGYINLSGQHVGTRFTQPADQELNPRTFTHNLPFGGQPVGSATTLNLKLPDYQLVNLSAGVDFDSGFSVVAYVNNLLDENALLAFDRERGGRARLGYHVGQPRTFGITARQKF
jgi:outer membrane receptor protein involved in Fe transport